MLQCKVTSTQTTNAGYVDKSGLLRQGCFGCYIPLIYLSSHNQRKTNNHEIMKNPNSCWLPRKDTYHKHIYQFVYIDIYLCVDHFNKAIIGPERNSFICEVQKCDSIFHKI